MAKLQKITKLKLIQHFITFYYSLRVVINSIPMGN